MLDKDFIKRKVKLIQEELVHIEEFVDFSFDEVAKDYRKLAIIERLILTSIFLRKKEFSGRILTSSTRSSLEAGGSSMDADIAADLAAELIDLPWSRKRRLLNLSSFHLLAIRVVIDSKEGEFFLDRHFTAWDQAREGISIVFVKDGQGARILPCLIRRTGTAWYEAALIEEPDLRGCLLAVLTGVPPDRDKLQTSPIHR